MFCFCVKARGIDVQQVSLVINYDLPANRENYIHRYIQCVCVCVLGDPCNMINFHTDNDQGLSLLASTIHSRGG